MFNEEINSFKLVLLEDNILYIDGIKRIIAIDKCECELQLKKKKLKIVGVGLTLKEMNTNEMKITGKINNIIFEDVGK